MTDLHLIERKLESIKANIELFLADYPENQKKPQELETALFYLNQVLSPVDLK